MGKVRIQIQKTTSYIAGYGELKGKSHKIVSGHINGANLEYSFFFSFLAPGACIGGLVSGIFKNLYLQNVCKLNP